MYNFEIDDVDFYIERVDEDHELLNNGTRVVSVFLENERRFLLSASATTDWEFFEFSVCEIFMIAYFHAYGMTDEIEELKDNYVDFVTKEYEEE